MTLKRTITHWTAGGNRANATDLDHYHFVTEYDGTVIPGKKEPEDNIVTSDGDYAAHVLNLNTGSIGVAMAGMRDAVESPFDAGPSPLTEKQFEAHCVLLAELHRKYAIPVGPKTCLTHAEVEPVLGVKQKGKWDITRLPFKPELRGAIAVGDYMRERVAHYIGAVGGVVPVRSNELLREGMQGESVKQLQSELAARGFVSYPDGKYGPRTVSAVKAFQKANGLEEDGIAGPATLGRLRSQDAVSAPARESSEAILKERGSKTIKAADTQGAALGAVAAVGTAGAVLETAQKASGIADGAFTLIAEKWWLLLVGAGLYVVWVLSKRIKAARVEAAVKGENLSK